MIVVDTNVLAYELIRAQYPEENDLAHGAFQRDAEWSAPRLWRSEFRNVLTKHIRGRGMDLTDAGACWEDATALLSGREHDVNGFEVIGLALRSGCTSYDCEFVAVAQALGVPLVTTDKQILKAFPNVAVSLADFAKGKK